MVTNEVLHAVPLFSYLTDDLLEWIRDHSNTVHLGDSELLFAEGEPANHFFVLLEGGIQITKQIGGRDVVLNTHKPGAFTGEVPILTGTPYVASAHSLGSSHLLSITSEEFFEMLRICTSIVRGLFAAMASRIQITETLVQQNEKLSGLGKLAAGLAHELNNPAAATSRAASQLNETIQHLNTSAQHLAQLLTQEQWARLAQVVEAKPSSSIPLAPLEQSDREDTLAAWMDDHDLNGGWELAPTFVNAGLTSEQFDQLAEGLASDTLEQALSWLEAALSAKDLLQTIEHSASHISDLVKSIKEYSYMDRAQLQEIDIHDGIENTLTILNHKLKGRIQIIREYDRSIPRICAYGSELNQVWTNILDNAADALGEQGEIHIRTWLEGNFVCVEIVDNGPGIPTEIQSRIFEPFFTTKEVGKGTGLGLDTTYRIVTLDHRGTLTLNSVPGATRFRICLPQDPGEATT